VIFVIIAIFFFAVVVFLFVLFVVGLFAKEDIGLALVPVELLLKAGLRIGRPPESSHGTLNCCPQSVQTPTAGVVLSHLRTIRPRWIMGLSLSPLAFRAAGYRGRS
jgi:hypothetical protein